MAKNLRYIFTLKKVGQKQLHTATGWSNLPGGVQKKLVVEEVMGTKRRSGLAKMIDNGKGVLWIRGKFKDNLPNPYFRLSLSSHVSSEDFQLGYSMSGHVARSFEKYISFQITHLAFVRRKDFQEPPASSSSEQNQKETTSKAARFVKNLCRVYIK